MAGKRKAARAHSLEAYYNASLEDLRAKLSRTIYAITAFHITNTGIMLSNTEMAMLRKEVLKAILAGQEYGVEYHGNKGS